MLGTLNSNYAAIRLYEKAGFTKYDCISYPDIYLRSFGVCYQYFILKL